MTSATLGGNLGSGNTPVRFDGRRIGGICIFCSLLAMTAVAAPTVTITGVAQRWPWNNKVDISYNVGDGQDVAEGRFRKMKFTAVINGETTTIDGDTIGASASDGPHTVTWKAPSGIKPTTMSLTAAMYESDAPSGDDYMIIDLASGVVKYEGLLASQGASDNRYNTNAVYKTDKMVLRKVAAGTYPAKGRDWTTDRPYYTGIFMVTRAQYLKLCSSLPATGGNSTFEGSPTEENPIAHRPVYRVTLKILRGVYDASDIVPSETGTFLQRLNSKTQSAASMTGFDVPTAQMAYIAARAGVSTKYWWGDDIDTSKLACLESLGNSGKSGNNIIAGSVGMFPANSWGIFDAAGNGYEATLCLGANGIYWPTATESSALAAMTVFAPYVREGSAGSFALIGGGAPNSQFSSDAWRFELDGILGVGKDSINNALIGFRVSYFER